MADNASYTPGSLQSGDDQLRAAAARLDEATANYWRARSELNKAQAEHDRLLGNWFRKHYAQPSRDAPPSPTSNSDEEGR